MAGKGLAALRIVALLSAMAIGASAFFIFLQIGSVDGIDGLDVFKAALILISTLWLAWGAIQGLMGLITTAKPPKYDPEAPIKGKTIILMPVYNEDPMVSLSRLAAMDMSLERAGDPAEIHFAVLSDTRNENVAAEEQTTFARLVQDRQGIGRFFYRRRTDNTGKKAGNIEDFIVRSGGAYDYAVILDADSLMEGETILQMIRRMEAEPRLGLLQTLPKIVRAESRFGRAMQFSASFFSPIFCRGLAMMQGETGPFWGHNAIVRVNAFAESCGLPVLRGAPPFGGHVMSHDYVEAALLARSGWIVRVDDDLQGSYEEGPENIIDHAKRDRRWCQGNLQHSRILGAPGLRPWSRFVFIQGIMAYIAPLFWLAFLAAMMGSAPFATQPDYFPEPNWPFPYFPPSKTAEAVGLFVGVFGLLLVPKLLVAVRASITGRARGFGGVFQSFASTIWELIFSSLIAPILLMFATRSVYQVLLGKDGGWPTNNRGDGRLTYKESIVASSWIVLTGIAGLLYGYFFAPELFVWLLPVGIPMICAPLILHWSSMPSTGGLFNVPMEYAPPPVLILHDYVLDAWSRDESQSASVENANG
ncbi:glucans biosynthesis glucosyltransferase MdoH [Rhizobium sp. L1K21]|uniref:glucans biosynthesis glucosyltransferase MdoH n=1 Tax=Rhizobium sp. L1K21 TaxID=2954933 RepID=UPI002092FD97|nr:glucans biosynthesis glucosyltransferase MdoH [Rhizobium sp. L1K21]MCO6184758.1 glucans biosynthesis glucosyltransferase MdoH [Rhizobium sp. L1K21]